jgi:uncharacterized protein (DUF1330 family)
MSYEILVGLNVLDDLKYADYRKAMTPILFAYDGRFAYDFKVSEVLISAGSMDINRVFTINFVSKNYMEGFFTDPDYLAVKEKYFVGAVGSTNIIAGYEKTTD